MRRKLKSLGIALAAVLALGTFGTVSAKATTVNHTFTSDSSTGNTILTGVNEGNEVFAAAPGTSIVCKETKFEGTQAGKEADELTLAAQYGETDEPSGCEDTALGAEAIVHFNHCAYVFDSDTPTGTDATAKVECEAGQKIEITVASVVFTVAPQTVDGGVRFTDVNRNLTLTSTANKIVMTCDGGILCELICGATKVCKEGTYNGATMISGYKDKLAVPVSGTSKTTVGNFPHGTQVDFGLTLPLKGDHTFTSDSSTGNTILTGVNEGNEVFAAAPLTSIVCKETKFEGTQAGKEADELTLAAQYGETDEPSGCEDTALGAEAIVHFNHCAYVFDSDTPTGTDATAKVECEAGQKIEITVAGIKFTVGPQTLGNGVSYTELDKSMTLTSTANKVLMTCDGGILCEIICGPTKVCENGTYNGKTLISGYRDDGPAVSGTSKTTVGNFSHGAQVDFGLTPPQEVDHTFTSDSSTGNTILTGVNEGTEVFAAAPGTSIICKTAKFAGTIGGAAADEVTVTAEYGATTKPSGCEDSILKEEVIVHFNHCAYVFESDTANGTHAPVGMECAEEGKIEITLGAGIVFSIRPQFTEGGLHYSEIGRDVTVEATVSSIEMACSGGATCDMLCGADTVCVSGTYNGKTLISGYKDSTPVTGTNKTTYASYNGTHNETTRVDLGLSTP